MKIKTTFRFHATLVRVPKVNHTLDSSFWQGCREHSYTAGRNTNLYRRYENQFAGSTEMRNLPVSRSNYTTCEHIHREISILPLLVAFFIIARNKKISTGLSTGEQKIICGSWFKRESHQITCK